MHIWLSIKDVNERLTRGTAPSSSSPLRGHRSSAGCRGSEPWGCRCNRQVWVAACGSSRRRSTTEAPGSYGGGIKCLSHDSLPLPPSLWIPPLLSFCVLEKECSLLGPSILLYTRHIELYRCAGPARCYDCTRWGQLVMHGQVVSGESNQNYVAKQKQNILEILPTVLMLRL